MGKTSLKYQIIRDGEYSNTVYNSFDEARIEGMYLINCGWISKFAIVPVRAIWLKV